MDRIKIFASEEGKRDFIIRLAVLFALLIGVWLLVRSYASFLTDPVELRNYIKSFGVLAPIALILLQAAQVVLAPIPGQVTGFVSGYLFGAFHGTLYSLIGLTVGSYIAYMISRKYGRPYVEKIVDRKLLDRFDSIDEDKGRLAIFLVFLIPGLPDDALCFFAGLTNIAIWELVLLSLLGRTPSYVLVNIAGARMANFRIYEGLFIILVLALISLVGYLKRRDIIRALQ